MATLYNTIAEAFAQQRQLSDGMSIFITCDKYKERNIAVTISNTSPYMLFQLSSNKLQLEHARVYKNEFFNPSYDLIFDTSWIILGYGFRPDYYSKNLKTF